METIQIYENGKHKESRDVEKIVIERDASIYGGYRRWATITDEHQNPVIIEIEIFAGEYAANIESAHTSNSIGPDSYPHPKK